MSELERARSALYSLDPSCTHDEWIRIGMAAKAAGLQEGDFIDWSKNGNNFKSESECKTKWKSFKKIGGITKNTLYYLARKNGWGDPVKQLTNTINFNSRNDNRQKKDCSDIKNVDKNICAFNIWERSLPAESTHGYILRKKGMPHGLRYYPHTEPKLIINSINVAGYLVVPCIFNDEIQTLQFIPPGEGKKLNLSGASFNSGYFVVGGVTFDLIYLVEGLAQAWATHKSTGATAVVCFGANRMMIVAKALQMKYPEARLVIISDRGKEKEASEIAKTIDGEWIKLPQDKPSNYDVNDYYLEHGEKAIHDILTRPELPLNVIFAHELPTEFTPPDELVEGILTAGDGSYGDTNTGKTFFVIDLTCSVARGNEWMGRKTEAGLVVYLAAESPASVKRHLQAYQKYHGILVPNYAIVQNPINLIDGEADTKAIIQTVHLLEKYYGQKARLIVSDTLARLSAGANENAGQDMGIVVRHFDYIRNECDAHFMLIHHSGKNAAAGARGRCAEITKQRDLGSKGLRIGFRLEPVTLGLTKWKSPATSCIVVPADAPQKSNGKRISEIGGAIIEYLRSIDKPIRKIELVKHFNGLYKPTPIYRQLKKLVETGVASDCMGCVKLMPIGAN